LYHTDSILTCAGRNTQEGTGNARMRKSNKYYIFWVHVCSLRYSACSAHAPYCYLWPIWLYNIFHITAQLSKPLSKNYWS